MDSVLLLISVLHANAIYVPLNITESREYTMNCIQDLSLSWVICTFEQHSECFPSWTSFSLSGAGLSNLKLIQFCDSPTLYSLPIAYIIHTSGTTRQGQGIPVAVPIATFENHIQSLSDALDVSSARRMVLLSEPTFDPSLVEVFIALCSASTLYIVSSHQVRQPDILYSKLKEYEIDLLMMTPSLFLSFSMDQMHDICQSCTMKDIVLGGEPFPEQILRMSRPFVNFWNIYGTTECSVWSCLYKIPGDQSHGPVPLGTPIGNTVVFIENQEKQGQLWMGGQERLCFVNKELRLYRPTGDIVSLDDDGTLYFNHRMDSQIKLFGYRIDLHQITQCISFGFPQIQFCMARNILLDSGMNALVVFLKSNVPLVREELERCCRSSLPFYAIPSFFIFISSIPLTLHGKVDVKSLEALFLQEHCKEDKLAFSPKKTFSEILFKMSGYEMKLGEYFLTQGGNSLLAIRVIHECIRSFALSSSITQSLLLQTLLHEPLFKTLELLENQESCIAPQEPPIKAAWKCFMEKCVDASPIIAKDCVYVGSHSGLFQCINVETGKAQWSQRLPNRIEGTALYLEGHDCVGVGCFDGCFYLLSAKEGFILSTFQTQGEIKSKATFDAKENHIWIGSYDQSIYCLKWMKRAEKHDLKLIFKQQLDGFIRSECCLDDSRRILYIPTTRGTLYAMDPDSFEILWKLQFDRPLFSRPLVCKETGNLFLGCTDGYLYCISSGKMQWKFFTNGPIFSSPCFYEKSVIVGCHSKEVFQIGFNSDSAWSLDVLETDAPVFSSPCVSQQGVLCFISTQGRITLKKGSILHSFQMEGDVFSSPCFDKDHRVIVGSRSDWVYCFNVSI